MVRVVSALCWFAFIFLTGFILLQVDHTAAAAVMKDKVVVIDPGHGGSDPGICNQLGCEKDINLAVARQLARLLKEKGAIVVLTRGDHIHQKLPVINEHQELLQRLQMANARRADIYVGLHVNSSSNLSCRGALTYYRHGNQQSRQLGESIQAALCRIPSMSKRTARPANPYLLNHLDVPAVLVELGYLSHPGEGPQLVNPDYQQLLARALTRGICVYFSVGKDLAVQAKTQGSRMESMLSRRSDEGRPRIALVIDDFGFEERPGVEAMFKLNRPLTFAIMPHLPGSRQQALRAAAAGYEVIVHLPMQPLQGKSSWLGPGAITAGMPAREIRQKASAGLAAVPYAVGFNNHMGSLITSREEMLEPVLAAAGEKGFFVLDSRTTENSRLYPLANKLGIPCIKRDVFLDDVQTVPYVKKQLALLADLAEKQGSAVGIGHVGHPATAQALAEMIPRLEARGIELVYLSELVN